MHLEHKGEERAQGYVRSGILSILHTYYVNPRISFLSLHSLLLKLPSHPDPLPMQPVMNYLWEGASHRGTCHCIKRVDNQFHAPSLCAQPKVRYTPGMHEKG